MAAQENAQQSLLQQLGLSVGGTQAIPAIQRSQYLADALQAIQRSGSDNIKNYSALGSNLLAEAILKHGQNKANQELIGKIQGSQTDSAAQAAKSAFGDEAALPTATPPIVAPPSVTPESMPQGAPASASPPVTPPPSGPSPQALANALVPAVPGSRAARNNNPGNLRPLPKGQMWNGQTGVSDGFDTFATPEAGDRAATINLQNQQAIHGLNTIGQIVSRWAPKGDGANNPAAYASAVSRMTGIPADQPIDLKDAATLQKVKSAMFAIEGGGRQQAPQAPAGAPPPAGAPMPQAMPPQAMGGAPAPIVPPSGAPQAQFSPSPANLGGQNAMPAPQGPPTGPHATPAERAFINERLSHPQGSQAWMEGYQTALKIGERARSPIELNKGEYFGPNGQAQSVHSMQNVAGSPNAFIQRDPVTGEIKSTANPAYGAVPGNAHMLSNGAVTPNAIVPQGGAMSAPQQGAPQGLPQGGQGGSEWSQPFTVPGLQGLQMRNNLTGEMKSAGTPSFTPKDLGERLTKLQASDSYKLADLSTNMFNAATQAAQRPGGISDVELRDFAARQFSGGVARQFNVDALNKAQGPWARLHQFIPELVTGQQMSPAARSAVLQAMHDDAIQAQNAFSALSNSDEAFAQSQGFSLKPYLEPLNRPLNAMPDPKSIPNGMPGVQPQNGQPTGTGPSGHAGNGGSSGPDARAAALAELARRGIHVGAGQ